MTDSRLYLDYSDIYGGVSSRVLSLTEEFGPLRTAGKGTMLLKLWLGFIKPEPSAMRCALSLPSSVMWVFCAQQIIHASITRAFAITVDPSLLGSRLGPGLNYRRGKCLFSLALEMKNLRMSCAVSSSYENSVYTVVRLTSRLICLSSLAVRWLEVRLLYCLT